MKKSILFFCLLLLCSALSFFKFQKLTLEVPLSQSSVDLYQMTSSLNASLKKVRNNSFEILSLKEKLSLQSFIEKKIRSFNLTKNFSFFLDSTDLLFPSEAKRKDLIAVLGRNEELLKCEISFNNVEGLVQIAECFNLETQAPILKPAEHLGLESGVHSFFYGSVWAQNQF